jgi:DNA-binding HxlR family transcriptional regulator
MIEVMTGVRTVNGPAVTEPALCDVGVRRAFDFLGKRWNGIILGTLSSGPAGFADLRRGVGSITDSVLSDRLSELVGAGLVLRTVTDHRPPKVTYELTPVGVHLLPVLHQLGQWAAEYLPASRCPSA